MKTTQTKQPPKHAARSKRPACDKFKATQKTQKATRKGRFLAK